MATGPFLCLPFFSDRLVMRLEQLSALGDQHEDQADDREREEAHDQRQGGTVERLADLVTEHAKEIGGS